MEARTGRLGQGNWDGTTVENRHEMTVGTGYLGLDNWESTAEAGPLEKTE